jgi:hypothetical protein
MRQRQRFHDYGLNKYISLIYPHHRVVTHISVKFLYFFKSFCFSAIPIRHINLRLPDTWRLQKSANSIRLFFRDFFIMSKKPMLVSSDVGCHILVRVKAILVREVRKCSQMFGFVKAT